MGKRWQIQKGRLKRVWWRHSLKGFGGFKRSQQGWQRNRAYANGKLIPPTSWRSEHRISYWNPKRAVAVRRGCLGDATAGKPCPAAVKQRVRTPGFFPFPFLWLHWPNPDGTQRAWTTDAVLKCSLLRQSRLREAKRDKQKTSSTEAT